MHITGSTPIPVHIFCHCCFTPRYMSSWFPCYCVVYLVCSVLYCVVHPYTKSVLFLSNAHLCYSFQQGTLPEYGVIYVAKQYPKWQQVILNTLKGLCREQQGKVWSVICSMLSTYSHVRMYSSRSPMCPYVLSMEISHVSLCTEHGDLPCVLMC